jgi:hypothetical protein
MVWASASIESKLTAMEAKKARRANIGCSGPGWLNSIRLHRLRSSSPTGSPRRKRCSAALASPGEVRFSVMHPLAPCTS